VSSTRPLSKTGTDIERLLLAAGVDEQPDAASVRRAAAALGIVPRVALLGIAAVIVRRVTGWSAGSAWRVLSLVGAVGVVGATAVAGVSVVDHANRAPLAPFATSSVAAPVAAPPQASSPASSPEVTPELTLTPGPSRVAPRRTMAVASADRLREEAEALDGVRARLAGGDLAGALVRLGDYDRRFAAGSLHEEAMLLRIEALARQHDRGARALAARFLAVYPASVHGDRVAALLRDLPDPAHP
jgi:hypothetical protein